MYYDYELYSLLFTYLLTCNIGTVSHQRICLTVYSISPIFQVDNVCVLRHQRIFPYHRHVSKQSATERFVLRRQKPGTVFRQK